MGNIQTPVEDVHHDFWSGKQKPNSTHGHVMNDSTYRLKKSESNRTWTGYMVIAFALVWVATIVSLWILTMNLTEGASQNAWYAVCGFASFAGTAMILCCLIWSLDDLPEGQQYLQVS